MLKFQEYLDTYISEQFDAVSDDWINDSTATDLENYLRSHNVGAKTKQKISVALIKIRDVEQKAGKAIQDLTVNSISKVAQHKPEKDDPKILDGKGKKPKHFLHLEK